MQLLEGCAFLTPGYIQRQMIKHKLMLPCTTEFLSQHWRQFEKTISTERKMKAKIEQTWALIHFTALVGKKKRTGR